MNIEGYNKKKKKKELDNQMKLFLIQYEWMAEARDGSLLLRPFHLIQD